MKKTNNESGFSAVELILVIVVIALLAVVGWMVYKNHHKTTTTTASKINNSSAQSTDPTAGWSTYTSSLGGFSFKYPSSGWKLEGLDNSTGNWVTGSAVTSNESSIDVNENSSQGLSTSEDDYQIVINIGNKEEAVTNDGLLTFDGGSILSTLSNGLEFWQTSEATFNGHGSNDPQCGSTSIVMTSIASDNNLYLRLANGQYLNYTGSFCAAPGETLNLTYQQQANSSEATIAKEVLGSFKF